MGVRGGQRGLLGSPFAVPRSQFSVGLFACWRSLARRNEGTGNGEPGTENGERAAVRVLARALLGCSARVPLELRRKTGTLPWYGDEYDLEDLVAYSNYGHKAEHCAQIAVYRDTLK